ASPTANTPAGERPSPSCLTGPPACGGGRPSPQPEPPRPMLTGAATPCSRHWPAASRAKVRRVPVVASQSSVTTSAICRAPRQPLSPACGFGGAEAQEESNAAVAVTNRPASPRIASRVNAGLAADARPRIRWLLRCGAPDGIRARNGIRVMVLPGCRRAGSRIEHRLHQFEVDRQLLQSLLVFAQQ